MQLLLKPSNHWFQEVWNGLNLGQFLLPQRWRRAVSGGSRMACIGELVWIHSGDPSSAIKFSHVLQQLRHSPPSGTDCPVIQTGCKDSDFQLESALVPGDRVWFPEWQIPSVMGSGTESS